MYKLGVDAQVGIFKHAIKYGDTTRILQLMQDDHVNLAAVDENGDTVLHILLQTREFSPQFLSTKIIGMLDIFIIQDLDSIYISICTINTCLETVLHLAVAERLKEVVDYLLKRKSNVNAIDSNGDSIAHHFVESTNVRFRKLYKRSLLRSECVETEIKEGSSFAEWLVSRGIDFDLRNNLGATALRLAIYYNLQHILPPLLRNARGINFVKRSKIQNLLHSFLQASYPSRWKVESSRGKWYETGRPVDSEIFPMELPVKIVQILFNRGISVDIEDEDGMTALHLAIFNKAQVPIVLMILDRFANISDELTVTIFHEIFKHNAGAQPYSDYVKIIEKLIAKGVNLNSKDANGKTCLYYAVYHAASAAVEVMRNGGALDFGVLTNDHESLLHVLVEPHCRVLPGAKEAVLDLLVSEGCGLNVRNHKGQTALYMAVHYGNLSIARKMIEHGADVNIQDCEKQLSPLHEAINQNSIKLVELLLNNGANVNSKSQDGRPLHLASHFRRKRILRTLLEHKAEVNARDCGGENALARALCMEIWGIIPAEGVQALLEHGADINDASVVDASPRCANRGVTAFLLQHWIKLRTANLPCSDEYQTRIVADDIGHEEYERVRVDCLREIETLKRTFIDSRTSLYRWLHMDPNRRFVHSQNENLRAIVDSPAIEKQFPQYSIVILGNYRETLTRKSLLEPAKEAWSRLTEIHLPDICLEQIFVHLNTGDLFEMAESLNLCV